VQPTAQETKWVERKDMVNTGESYEREDEKASSKKDSGSTISGNA
jgi:hypothetical protein